LIDSEGLLQVSSAENNKVNTQFGISVPIIDDRLAVRVSGIYDENSMEGTKNISTGTEQSSTTTSGRVTVVLDPVDDLSFSLVSQYLERDFNPAFPRAGGAVGQPIFETYDRKALADFDGIGFSRTGLSVLTAEWLIADHQFTSLSGYVKQRTENIYDRDFENTTPGVATQTVYMTESEEFTQELRVATVENTFWEYMFGAYYHKRDSVTDFDVEAFPGSGVFFEFDIPIREEEFGLFTHNTFNIQDHSRVQLGLRWLKIRRFNRADGSIPAFGFQSPYIRDENEFKSTEEVTGSLKYSYDVSDDITAYASIERGFRPGGTTVSSSPFTQDLLLFDDETSDSFEIGFKSFLLDRHLQLNGALYYQAFDGFIGLATDLRVDALVNATGLPGSDGNVDNVGPEQITFNADATIIGTELEFTALVSESFAFGGGVSYNDATYDDGAEGPCTVFDAANIPVIPAGDMVAMCDLSGQRIGGEANWSASLNGEYVWPQGDSEYFLNGLYKFNGSKANDDINEDSGSYGVANVYAGVRDSQGKWGVSVWVKNLTDKQAERAVFAIRNGYRNVSIIQERSFGVTGTYNY
jgi:iron complex outermembrane recepter protein